MKNVLIISYYWPPSGGGGVQRVLKFCKYLPDYGWNPIVLTVKDGEFPAFDNSLLEDVNDIVCYKIKGFSLYSIFKKFSGKKNVPTHQISPGNADNVIIRLARWIRFNLVIPDGRIGWYRGAIKAAKKIIHDNNIDMILTSGPPHSVHLIGNSLAKKTGIKWVTDFRDPWTDNFYYNENPRNFLITYLDNYLEKLVLK
ncbi:group 1 glycosyl transferase, partial [bacterium]|nr:group 1 glycosyl transferase [bacterium]